MYRVGQKTRLFLDVRVLYLITLKDVSYIELFISFCYFVCRYIYKLSYNG